MYVWMYIYVCMSSRIFQKVIDSYKHDVVNTPPPNYPVSSSYKTPNCLNIRNSLDILDSSHLRK